MPKTNNSVMTQTLRVFRIDREFVDCYTVVVYNGGMFDIYTMSPNPGHPQGVNQFSATLPEYTPSNYEELVPLSILPRNVLVAIIQRLTHYLT